MRKEQTDVGGHPHSRGRDAAREQHYEYQYVGGYEPDSG